MFKELKTSIALPACGIALATASFADRSNLQSAQAVKLDQKASIQQNGKDLKEASTSIFDKLDLRKAYDSAFGNNLISKSNDQGISKTSTTPSEKHPKPTNSLAIIPALLLGMTKRFRSLFGGSAEKTNQSASKSPSSIFDERIARAASTIKKVESTPKNTPKLVPLTKEIPNGEEKSYLKILHRTWAMWENVAEKLPTPWNKIAKFGIPTVAATCGIVWFQSALQIGILGVEIFGGAAKPILGMAALLIPAIKASSILSGIEKLLHKTPISGWRREAILRPTQAALIGGAAIWAQAMDLTPLTYGIWGAAVVGCGFLAKKLIGNISRSTWTAMATALVLPWSHLMTVRTFDVTVKAAGPDPEVAAWNVTTDLSIKDHWLKLAFLKTQTPPSGGSGMVFLNRDVPLFIPSHRNANAFNGEFSNLVGKKVQITTTGAWLKPLSAKLQPTIVSYKVLDN